MLKAEEMQLSPEALVERMRTEHIRDFARFHIHHDNYYSTHSEENRELSELIYHRCRDADKIFTKSVERPFDAVKGMFLADRFIRGECPECGAADQYGDACEACGATYNAVELVNPVSILSGTEPQKRASEHLFFDLPALAGFLKEWTRSGAIHTSIANKLDEWLETGLIPWDISRDAPYFGFAIPDTEDKFFYVWVDAPVGYISSFRNYAVRCPALSFDDYWDARQAARAGTEVHHFIGKDIIYFHALFWPAMLQCAGFRTPTRIHTHGFLTMGNAKMSKSRGSFIDIGTYCEHLDPEYLRYYFAARIVPGIDDINMDLADFRKRVNSDLVGKLVNIASRCAKFIHKYFDGFLSAGLPQPGLWEEAAGRAERIAGHFENSDYARAVREIMNLADAANRYIDQEKPWILAKDDPHSPHIQAVCTQGLNQFRLLMIYLKPVLPVMARKVEDFLGIAPLSWKDLQAPLLDVRINEFQPLMDRISSVAIQALLPSREPVAAQESKRKVEPAEAIKKESPKRIGMTTFTQIDLRVARIQCAETVPGSDRLLKLTLDLGDETRQVFSGIRSAYAPEQLEGRLTIVVVNLEPRKMRFGISDGMVLAACADNDPGIFLLQPDQGAHPGMRVC